MKLSDLWQLAVQLTPPLTPDKHTLMQDLLRQMGLDPDNLYQELEMSSRLVDTHRDVSEVGGVVQLHSHVFYEMIYC